MNMTYRINTFDKAKQISNCHYENNQCSSQYKPNVSSKMQFAKFARAHKNGYSNKYVSICSPHQQTNFYSTPCSFFESDQDQMAILCIYQNYPNVVTSSDNKLIWNTLSYNSYTHIGVNIGNYSINSLSDSNAIGFVIDNPSLFEITSGIAYGTPVTIEGVSVQHYSGNITFSVNGDFGSISYHNYNNGYMGGYKRLRFIQTC